MNRETCWQHSHGDSESADTTGQLSTAYNIDVFYFGIHIQEATIPINFVDLVKYIKSFFPRSIVTLEHVDNKSLSVIQVWHLK